mgnify:CR=1 FL=1
MIEINFDEEEDFLERLKLRAIELQHEFFNNVNQLTLLVKQISKLPQRNKYFYDISEIEKSLNIAIKPINDKRFIRSESSRIL